MADLKRLQSRHKKIAELYLEGMKIVDIARELGMPPNSVSRIVNSPLFQDYVSKRREERQRRIDDVKAASVVEARERLKNAAMSAVERLEQLMREGSESTQVKSAATILKHAFEEGEDEKVVVVKGANMALLISALKESEEGEGSETNSGDEGTPEGEGEE